MKIQKGLLIILFVMMFSVITAASTNDNNDKRVYISENFEISDVPNSEEALSKQFFFFICEGSIENSDVGSAFLFFSNAKIGENVTGNFYTFFSDLRLETINTSLAVKTLFSKVFVSGENSALISQIFDWAGIFQRIQIDEGLVLYDGTVNPMLLRLIKELLIVGLFSLFFATRKSFFEQGSLALKYEYIRIFKSGLATYAVVLCGSVIFLLTVFGIILSVVLMFTAVVAALVGCAALYLFIGGLVIEKIRTRRNVYIEMIIGLAAVELISAIPYVRIAVYSVIIPITTLGVVYTAFMNMYINKNFYESPYMIG